MCFEFREEVGRSVRELRVTGGRGGLGIFGGDLVKGIFGDFWGFLGIFAFRSEARKSTLI